MSTEIFLNQIKNFNNYDIVIASEVIEHVNNRNLFLSDISNLCRSEALLFLLQSINLLWGYF